MFETFFIFSLSSILLMLMSLRSKLLTLHCTPPPQLFNFRTDTFPGEPCCLMIALIVNVFNIKNLLWSPTGYVTTDDGLISLRILFSIHFLTADVSNYQSQVQYFFYNSLKFRIYTLYIHTSQIAWFGNLFAENFP